MGRQCLGRVGRGRPSGGSGAEGRGAHGPCTALCPSLSVSPLVSDRLSCSFSSLQVSCPSTLLSASGCFCSYRCVRQILLGALVMLLLIYASVSVCHSGCVLGGSARLCACMFQRVHVDICICAPVCVCVCGVCVCPSAGIRTCFCPDRHIYVSVWQGACVDHCA